MSKKLKVEKTLRQKLSDLDDHLYLLRDHLHRLGEGMAHLKILSAELRTLICFSSGTEGLLWRLVEELKVADQIHLHVAGRVNADHPLARGLKFAIVPIQHGGLGDPRLPADYYFLKDVIKENDAVFIKGKGLTHEYLIKAISQQMGSAHEDEGLEYALDDLNRIFINGVQPYVGVLALDAELVLQVGERILEKAEIEMGYKRKARTRGYGDLSIIIRFGLKQILAGKKPVFSFESHISEIKIKCEAGPQSLVFSIIKRGQLAKEIRASYPEGWELRTDAVFSLEYSSEARRFHAITNDVSQDKGLDGDVGLLMANELIKKDTSRDIDEFAYSPFLLLYGRLISPKECLDLLNLPPDEITTLSTRINT